MKSRASYGIGSFLLAAGLSVALSGTARAERLGADVIAMFPENLGEFAYADLKAARSQKALSVLEVQFLPDHLSQVQSALASRGIDLLQQADEVAWGFVPASPYSAGDTSAKEIAATTEQMAGIALGSYNLGSFEAYFQQKKRPAIETAGVTLFAVQATAGPNDLFVTFLDSSTLAFGHRVALQRMMEIRAGLHSGVIENTRLYSLIAEANGGGAFWAVLDAAYSKGTVAQLAPELGKFAQSSKVLQSVKGVVVKVDADGGIQGQAQLMVSSSDDANVLGQLLQLGLLYESYQASSKQNRSFADLLSRAQVFPAGDRVTLRISVNEDEAAALPSVLSASNAEAVR